MKHIIALALLAASTAFAHGSSHPAPQAAGPDPVGFIKLEDAPRVVAFEPARNWFNTEGQLMVCPFDASTGDRECKRGKNDAWILATEYKVDGHALIGYQIIYTGAYSSKQLHLYFAKPKPAVAATSAKPEMLTFTGPITINADKVVVHRRKH